MLPSRLILLALAVSLICVTKVHGQHAEGNSSGSENETSAHHASVRVARFDFNRVSTPFTFAFAIFVAGIVKLIFHSWEKLASTTPESCLLIAFGLIVGAIVQALSPDFITFTPNLFFLYLLPPIMLEAGYLMKRRAFFDNLGTILLYAVVGTLWNTFSMAIGLYFLRKIDAITIVTKFEFSECLLFGAISAAVDPVAVLAIFDEVHVNVALFILVFGESIINDAVSVVLYQSAETFVELPSIDAADIALSFASFFTVSIGGLLIGVVYGLIASFITRFTEKVQILEILTTLLCGYLSFISAEIFHFSGILSAISCGLVMRHYLHENISINSRITVKYLMKMLSAASETAIFIFLGLEAVKSRFVWDTGLVLGTLIFALVFRFIGVFALTYLVNHYRVFPISLTEQIIMGYGGLRGAVSFSLVLLLEESAVPSKHAMFTAAFCLIIFTVFLQGMTIKPLVNYLHVAKDSGTKPSANVLMHCKAVDHIVAGIEEIIGQIGDQRFYELLAYYDLRYLTPFFTKSPAEAAETLVSQVERAFYHQNKPPHHLKHASSVSHNRMVMALGLSPSDQGTGTSNTPPELATAPKPSKVCASLPPRKDGVASDDFIRQLLMPTTADTLVGAARSRNHVPDDQIAHRLQMMRMNQAMQQALEIAHFSHHNHHSHNRNSRHSRQAMHIWRGGEVNSPMRSSLSSGATMELPRKRRVVSEGDKESLDAGDCAVSIATMSDPSIHFETFACVDNPERKDAGDETPRPSSLP